MGRDIYCFVFTSHCKSRSRGKKKLQHLF